MLSCDGIRKVTHATSRQPLQSLNLLAVLCLVQSSESLKIDIGSCWISGVDVDPCRVREREREASLIAPSARGLQNLALPGPIQMFSGKKHLKMFNFFPIGVKSLLHVGYLQWQLPCSIHQGRQSQGCRFTAFI